MSNHAVNHLGNPQYFTKVIFFFSFQFQFRYVVGIENIYTYYRYTRIVWCEKKIISM